MVGKTGDNTPGILGGFTRGLFVTTGRLGDPELAGAAGIDVFRSQFNADFRDAGVVVGNNAATGVNFRGIATSRGIAHKNFQLPRSSKIFDPSVRGPPVILEHVASDFS